MSNLGTNIAAVIVEEEKQIFSRGVNVWHEDDRFKHQQQNFLDKHYLEFEDCEENKLSYVPIFSEYVGLVEQHLEQQLTERIPGFNMNNFTELLMKKEDEVPGDIIYLLSTFTDFVAFKKMFIDYRADKEGRGLDLSQALVITPLNSAFKHP